MSLASTNLFKPIKVGSVTLSNRVVVAPLTRARATADHTPTDLMLTHFDDLTKTPGSLVITDATFPHKKAGDMLNTPGVYEEKHLKAWKKITDKVHENKSFISAQLWSLGRSASVELLTAQGLKYVSSSDVYVDDATKELAEKLNNPLKPMTIEEIKEHVKIFADAAENCVKKAGFDFVELHGAHGYLFDQFFLQAANHRTDEYGGSIENRARFFLETVDAIIERIGGDKVACRFSPFVQFPGLPGIDGDPSPYAQFGYIYGELEKRRKEHGFGYISIVEPRFSFGDLLKVIRGSNDFTFDIFKGTVLRAGSYLNDPKDTTLIENDVNKNDRTLIIIGRFSTSNPDIVEKLRNGWELTPYERDTFYVPGNWGYNTFTRHGEVKTFDKEAEKKNLGVALA